MASTSRNIAEWGSEIDRLLDNYSDDESIDADDPADIGLDYAQI